MMRYRTLLLGLIGLFLAGCAGYDFDDDYGRNYGRSGYGGAGSPYGTTYVSPYGGAYSSGNSYIVQRYEVYPAPRYYRAPAPRYYAPPPQPRYYAPPPHRRPPIQQGWGQAPRGYYSQPGRDHDRRERHERHDRDDRWGNEHRGHDQRREHGDGRNRHR